MKKGMIILSLTVALFALLITTACKDGGIYIMTDPPAPQYEAVPPSPGPQHAWVEGHWHWNGSRWVWIPGHYQRAPRHQQTWVPGRWEKRRGRWVWIEGHWR